jgi:hypothetical protein
MSLTYFSGEEIRAGDRILYRGESGRVEFVATRGDPGPQRDSVLEWHIEQFGGGCMVDAPNWGRIFVTEPNEDLEFVARDGPLQ